MISYERFYSSTWHSVQAGATLVRFGETGQGFSQVGKQQTSCAVDFFMRTMLPLGLKNYTNVVYLYRFKPSEGKTDLKKV